MKLNHLLKKVFFQTPKPHRPAEIRLKTEQMEERVVPDAAPIVPTLTSGISSGTVVTQKNVAIASVLGTQTENSNFQQTQIQSLSFSTPNALLNGLLSNGSQESSQEEYFDEPVDVIVVYGWQPGQKDVKEDIGTQTEATNKTFDSSSIGDILFPPGNGTATPSTNISASVEATQTNPNETFSGPDSVSQSLTRAIASGNVAEVRALMETIREAGAAIAPELEAAATRFLTEAAKKEAAAAAAAAAAQQALVNWAKSRGLNAASEFTKFLYANRAKTVQEFIGMARKGGVKEVLPETAKKMTVEEALKKGTVDGVNIRKILTDNRDKFVK